MVKYTERRIALLVGLGLASGLTWVYPQLLGLALGIALGIVLGIALALIPYEER